MNTLQSVSILLEIVVALLGIMLATVKKKKYGWCITLTFAIYVFYDLAHFFALKVSQSLLHLLFFIATISILWVVWRLYKRS
jgi:hypothetical protein